MFINALADWCSIGTLTPLGIFLSAPGLERASVDFLFSPLEGGGVLIPVVDKGLDRLDQHFDAGKAGSLQCAAA